MRICFIVDEIFAWGKYGGFGRMTRAIGSELVKRGIDVFAVVPKRKDQKPVEELDGMTVLSFPRSLHLFSKTLYKACDADIYHSEEPSLGTYLAMKAVPDKRHIVTCIDPRDKEDWKIEYKLYSMQRKLLFIIYNLFTDYFIKESVRRADAVYCQTKFIIPKVKLMYGLSEDPGFLANPIDVPERKLKKAEEPTVCFLARWDRRKRPEIFFKLAKKFPNVKFIAIGKSHDEKWDKYLRKKYSNIPNLRMTGFIDFFSSNQIEKILEESWIMVNTSAREGLPISFLEATAYKCAILSAQNPDNFAEKFGYHVRNDDYASGLRYLLKDERWKERGMRGYNYVKDAYELNKVIDKHISMYMSLLNM